MLRQRVERRRDGIMRLSHLSDQHERRFKQVRSQLVISAFGNRASTILLRFTTLLGRLIDYDRTQSTLLRRDVHL